MTIVILAAAGGFILSFALTGAMRRYALGRSMVDVPNHRTSHTRPTPRGGGMSFIIAWVLIFVIAWGMGYVPGWLAAAILPGAALLAGAGFADDHISVPAILRLVIQLAAASILVYFIGGWPKIGAGSFAVEWGFIGSVIAVVAVVWSVNLFNFMDGIDSIASVEAISVLAPGAAMLAVSGAEAEGAYIALLAVCVLGFLVWNLPPAKIFMGDGGSYFLGYMIAAAALIGEVKYGVPALLWAMLYGVFWFDATVTLVRRTAKRHKWSKPHRLHAYQRLHQSGWTHGAVTAAVMGVNALLNVLAAVAFFFHALIPFCFAAVLAILAAAYIAVELARPMPEKLH